MGRGRIAQLVKSPDLQSIDRGLEPSFQRVFLFWFGPLARTSLETASVGLDHHGKKWRSQPVGGLRPLYGW